MMDIHFPQGQVYAPNHPSDIQQLSQQQPLTPSDMPLQQQQTYAPVNNPPSLAPPNYMIPFGSATTELEASSSPVSGLPDLTANDLTYSIIHTPSITQYHGAIAAYMESSCSYHQTQAFLPQSQNTQTCQQFDFPALSHLANFHPTPVDNSCEESGSSLLGEHISSTTLALQGDREQLPTHVVGSQGRRGILPSTVGRPAAVPPTANQKAGNLPAKDAEGKFPCPHCNKTYLHAKHLKRHLLRHTGTRPYSCGLCRDTFSRSDILKRHFQKCSVRRGNPTGENHLSHSRATKKSDLEAAGKMIKEEISLPDRTRTLSRQPTAATDFSATNFQESFDLSTLALNPSGYPEDQQAFSNRVSRSNSVNQGHPGNFVGSSSSSFDPTGFPYSGGQVTPDSITTSGAATPYQYSNQTRISQFTVDAVFLNAQPNGSGKASTPPNYTGGSLPQILEASNGPGSDVNWSNFFAPDGQEGNPDTLFQSVSDDPQQIIKSEPDFVTPPFSLSEDYPPYSPTKV